ncbi:MAG: hypothetical protein O2799_04930 [Planctomycetota bacterium]|nr:hypothetical protein [Planctomycetota bacterium]
MLTALLLAPLVLPQDTDLEARVRALETEREAFARQVEILAMELERRDLGTVAYGDLQAVSGLGPAASRIYATESGASIGGYGELLYGFDPDGQDEFDALRGVIYLGYRFSDQWLVNTEFEFEHGTESFLEYSWVDYLATEEFALRGGLLLSPLGFVNESHEPTTYLPVGRSQTETRIIPTTMREMGVGAWGQSGSVEWRAYVINSLNGERFNSGGLRAGRTKGDRADAEDLSVTARMDWRATPGLTLGGGFQAGDSAGANARDLGTDLGTLIVELHASWQWGAWDARALAARADLDGAAAFNAATPGANLAERMDGAYLEVGYDLLAGREDAARLLPYVRLETIDTQAALPSNASRQDEASDRYFTVGLNYQPTPGVVVKLDHQTSDNGDDRIGFFIGYAF